MNQSIFTSNRRLRKKIRHLAKKTENEKPFLSRYCDRIIALPRKEAQQIEQNWKSVIILAKKFGLKEEPKQPFRIHPVTNEIIIEVSENRASHGLCDQMHKEGLVEQSHSPLRTALIISHEWLHLLSHKVRGYSAGTLYYRRSGLSTISKDEDVKYFSEAEEALIAMLVWKLYTLYYNEVEIYRPEYQYVARIVNQLRMCVAQKQFSEEQHVIIGNILDSITTFPQKDSRYLVKVLESKASVDYKLDFFWCYWQSLGLDFDNIRIERYREVTKFISLLIDMRKRSGCTEEQIFKLFTQTHFTGKILPLSRLINQCYGSGSYRALGNEFGSEI